MGRIFHFYNRLAIFALALALPLVSAQADPKKDLNFKGLYEIKFAALPMGKIGIHARQQDNRYEITGDIASSSIVNVFSKHSSHTTATGTGTAYAYPDVDYQTHYRIKSKSKSAKLVYRDGQVVEQQVVPPDDPAKRPPVAADLKAGSTDPISLILLARQQLIEALATQASAMTAKVYDGRRLMQVDMTLKGKRTITIGKKKYPTIVVQARRKPLAGYTQSEMEDYSPKEPSLYIYFSNDERLFPVKLELAFLFGALSVNLARECAEAESCLLGIKE